MTNTFCAALFRHLMLYPDGKISPCCYFEKPETNFEALSINTISLEDAFQSPRMHEIRELVNKGLPVSGCEKCYQADATGTRSSRQKYNQLFKINSIPEKIYLESLDISLGNKCNLRCRSCSSLFSSKWEPLQEQLEINKKYPKLKGQASTKTEQISDETLKQLKNCCIIGGETLLGKEFQNILQRIIDLENYNCHIEFSTNCTIAPSEEVIKLLRKFKSVEVSLSIDGLDKENELLRPVHKWEILLETSHKWIKAAKENDNLTIAMATTISAYNILTYPKLFQWWIEVTEDLPAYKKYNYICRLFQPSYLQVGVLPKNARVEISKIIEQEMNLIKHSLSNSLLANLKSLLLIDAEEFYTDFISYSKELDKIDDLSTFTVFNKLADQLVAANHEF